LFSSTKAGSQNAKGHGASPLASEDELPVYPVFQFADRVGNIPKSFAPVFKEHLRIFIQLSEMKNKAINSSITLVKKNASNKLIFFYIHV
jgi:hypothetical protein